MPASAQARMSGFGLAETLIAIAVATIAITAVVPSLSQARTEARLQATAHEMHRIADWVERARLSGNTLPTGSTISTLTALFTSPADLPATNHWGNAYTVGATANSGSVQTTIPASVGATTMEGTTTIDGSGDIVWTIGVKTSTAGQARALKILVHEESAP